MQYRDQEFRYDAENLLELESDFVRQLSDGKQYRQKRSSRPKSPQHKQGSASRLRHGARRNRRWTW